MWKCIHLQLAIQAFTLRGQEAGAACHASSSELQTVYCLAAFHPKQAAKMCDDASRKQRRVPSTRSASPTCSLPRFPRRLVPSALAGRRGRNAQNSDCQTAALVQGAVCEQRSKHSDLANQEIARNRRPTLFGQLRHCNVCNPPSCKQSIPINASRSSSSKGKFTNYSQRHGAGKEQQPGRYRIAATSLSPHQPNLKC